MFGSQLSRTGLLVALSGLAVLGASYYAWSKTRPSHGLSGTQDDYKWVRADSSSDPAVETDEVWQTSATCQLPYFIAATMRAKAELKGFYDAAPEEIRDWHDRPARPLVPRAPANEADFQNLLRHEQADLERSIAEADYDLRLHAKYMEWYVTASKLEERAKRWQWRLSNVADRRMTLSEARRRSRGVRSSNGIQQVAVTNNHLEQDVLPLLGLDGFSKDQSQALKTRCVEIIPVKKIFTPTKLWHWPVDHLASFSLGLELLFVGLLFGPISRWISAGDMRTEWRHLRQTMQRLVTTAGIVLKSEFALIAHAFREHVGKAAKRLVIMVRGLGRSRSAYIAQTMMWPQLREAARRLLMTVRGPFHEGANNQAVHRSRAPSYRQGSYGYQRRRPLRSLQR